MNVTEDQEKLVYQVCIEQGLSLQYGKLSLCDLRNFRYSHVKYDRKYQVHCEDARCEHSMIYEELEPAVEKFVELKKFAKRLK